MECLLGEDEIDVILNVAPVLVAVDFHGICVAAVGVFALNSGLTGYFGFPFHPSNTG